MAYKTYEVSCAGANLSLIFLKVVAVDHVAAVADCEEAGYEVVGVALL